MHSAPDLGNTLEQRIERMSPEAWAVLEQHGIAGDETIARAWGNGNGRAWGTVGVDLASGGGRNAAGASPTDTAVGLPIGEPFRLRPDRAAGDQSTSLCNLDCSYCYLPDRQRRNIFDLEQQLPLLLKRMKVRSGVPSCRFSGTPVNR